MRRIKIFFLATAALMLNSGKPLSENAAGMADLSIVRVIDLNIGQAEKVTLSDGSVSTVKVMGVEEHHESVTNMLTNAVVKVEINGEQADLVCGCYHLPVKVGGVQVDVPVVANYMKDSHIDWWKLRKDVRLRLWPAGSPWIEPGTFMYPVRQRWFASSTSYSNEPVSRRTTGKVYYHSGMDTGGAEGMTEVVAATDGIVITLGDRVAEGRKHPAAEPRYDVIYIEDSRGWVYRYSHLNTLDPALVPGGKVRKGQRLGYIGKEGSSGGWAHLHFDVSSLQPSGEWGIQDSYAFLWQAYLEEFGPEVIAVARPYQDVLVGEKTLLDGSKSWAKSGIKSFDWLFMDGTKATGPTSIRVYDQPGIYSEILKITDAKGNIDYDFASVRVYAGANKDGTSSVVRVHAAYYPTFGIKPGDPVIFRSRAFLPYAGGNDILDFGDGTPKVSVPSNIDMAQHAANGYGMVIHHFRKPGHYIVRVERRDEQTGYVAVQHLHVEVEK
jgi:murein DD-endopeptidase MepM/ murein hydrolase activator NlpD